MEQENNKNKSMSNTIKKHLLYTFCLVLVCLASTILSLALNNLGMGKENALMVFIIGVLIIAVLTKGYLYGFITSIISTLLINYFFMDPMYSFSIKDTKDYTMVIFFFLASLINGTLSAKFQIQTEKALQNEKTVRLLYDISRSFLNITGIAVVVNNGMHYIKEYTGYECSVILNQEKTNLANNTFSTSDFPTYFQNRSDVYTFPIMNLSNRIGTLSIAGAPYQLPREQDILIKTVVSKMALVLDREFMYNERERIKLAMESEHLKSTLLRSISHDLRTPLTGIMGASSLILDSYDNLDPTNIKKLVSDINEESSRLIHSVQNILDMTRISEGRLAVKKDFEALDDLISLAVSQASALTRTNRLRVTVPDEILLVECDGRLIVQVLVNLLDNANKYSGSESTVHLEARKKQNLVIIEISDNGPGIDKAIEDSLFEEFVTLPKNSSDSGRGVGLGLSICKAIVEAHNGKINAFNKPEGGAVFQIELPCEESEDLYGI